MQRLRPLAFAVPFLLLPAAARSTTLNWKTAVSGMAATAGNWTPAGPPTSADDAVFNLAGAYTVQWDGVAGTHSQLYRQGTVVSTNASAHTIGTNIKVGDLAGDNATLSIASGAITATTAFIVGNAAGSTGTLALTGPTAQITTTGTSDIAVGQNGTGTLNLTNGGRVTVANFASFGFGATATGNMLVSGISASAVRSHFTSGPGTLTIASAGHASVTVDNGGLVDVSNRVSVAGGAGSVGSVLVQNSSGGIGSAFNVAGTLDVAVAPGAGAAGTGSFDLTNFGTGTITGLTTVGDPNGGTGTLHVRNKTTFTSGGLVFDNAHGVLDFTGGTIAVLGGVFDPPGTTLDLAGNNRRVQLQSGASASFSNSPLDAYSLIVGETSTANLDVFGGSTLDASATVALGLNPTGVGGLDIDNSTWTPAGSAQLVVGLSGTGSFLVHNGSATVRLLSLIAGYATGSLGTILVEGPGASLGATSMVLGGHGTTAGGTVNVTVDDGASLSSDGDAIGITILPPANLFVNTGGTVSAPVEIDNYGDVTLNAGTITTGTFVMKPDATLTGNGAIHGMFSASDTTTFLSASGGPLEIGDPNLDGAFVMSGTFKVGTTDVHVMSRTSSSLRSCSISGGSLDLRPGGGVVPPLRTLSAEGTIRGKLINGGSISTHVPGATFTDTLLSSNHPLIGAGITFAPGSTFLGFGAIETDAVTVQAGATMQFTGASSLGKNAATTVVTVDGRMVLGSGTSVTVNHPGVSVFHLGSLTRLGSGSTLSRAAGFEIDPGDSLDGTGTITGPLLNVGDVTPGVESNPAARFGTINVAGTYQQGVAGKLTIQIGNASTNQFDKVLVTGAASLAGTLDVRLPQGFAPTAGEQYTIMTYPSRTGTFFTVTFQGLPVGNKFTLFYNATSLVLRVNSIVVDVPADPPAALAFAARSGTLEQATFTLTLPEAAHVRIALYGVTGRCIATLCDRDLPAGVQRFRLSDLAEQPRAGVWFARADVATPRGLETRAARVVLRR
jgi:T5SS/PEP-CTERM-associated repeat protein